VLGHSDRQALTKSASRTITGDETWLGLPSVPAGSCWRVLKPLGVGQVEAAQKVGVSFHRMNEIVVGKRGITVSGRDASGLPFVAGVYPLRLDETCFFLAVDFDKEGWQADSIAFLKGCRRLGLTAPSNVHGRDGEATRGCSSSAPFLQRWRAGSARIC
jgi:hypothetical protein